MSSDLLEFPHCFGLCHIQEDAFSLSLIKHEIQLGCCFWASWGSLALLSRDRIPVQPPEGRPRGFSSPVLLLTVFLSNCKLSQVFTYCGHETQTGCKSQKQTKTEHEKKMTLSLVSSCLESELFAALERCTVCFKTHSTLSSIHEWEAIVPEMKTAHWTPLPWKWNEHFPSAFAILYL